MSLIATVIPTKSHSLAGGAILAPMSGITDAGLRRIAQRFGAARVVSEMVACDQLILRDAEACLRAEGEGISTHVIQIAGCEAYWMAEGAKAAEAAGAAVIDINMGCPAKKVTNGWSGSALMRDLDHACHLIEATVAAVKVPVTLKTRLGWDHASLNAPELARRAESLGITMVTIHGRTRQQFYKGTADWAAVRAVRDAMPLPLVVNGDIVDTPTAQHALALSGADMVMIGRAAMGRPWLLGEVSSALRGEAWEAPTAAEKCAAAIEHYQWLLTSMGREKGLRHARKHIGAYLEEASRFGSGAATAMMQEMLTCDEPETVIAGLGAAFSEAGNSQVTHESGALRQVA